jgi:hypothetical protein
MLLSYYAAERPTKEVRSSSGVCVPSFARSLARSPARGRTTHGAQGKEGTDAPSSRRLAPARRSGRLVRKIVVVVVVVRNSAPASFFRVGTEEAERRRTALARRSAAERRTPASASVSSVPRIKMQGGAVRCGVVRRLVFFAHPPKSERATRRVGAGKRRQDVRRSAFPPSLAVRPMRLRPGNGASPVLPRAPHSWSTRGPRSFSSSSDGTHGDGS